MKEKETIEYLDLKTLVPFQNHPFKLRDGEEKEQLLQSIKTQGAIEPLIVRPAVFGGKVHPVEQQAVEHFCVGGNRLVFFFCE